MKYLALLLLFGCSDSVLYKAEPREPHIIITPNILLFEDKNVFENSHKEILTVINSGNATLEVDIKIESDFYHIDEYVYLEENEYQELEVLFDPLTEQSYSGYITITSNDEERPYIEVPVDGNGLAPVISITPDFYDFEEVRLGCEESIDIILKNEGSIDLEINNILQYSSLPEDITANLQQANNGALPWSIKKDEEYVISMDYIPSDLVDDESRISIDSNDPINQNLEISQIGTGDPGAINEDIYRQGETPVVDIIFVIDDSGSMRPFQTEILNNISYFMSVLSTQSIDYHISFLTTTNEIPVGQIIDNQVSDPVLEVESQVSSIGIHGSGMEKGIQHSHTALQANGTLGPGSAFYRESAALAIVYVSDEPDWSSGVWSDYTAYFSGLKPNPDQFIIHSIIGDYPSGCTLSSQNGNGNAQFGEGYYEITNFFNGNVYSICSTDWGQQMQNLAWSVIPTGEFELTHGTPIESTIIVEVDGISNSYWTFDSSTNSVVFDSSYIPGPGSEIKISYSSYGSCDDDDNIEN